MFTTANKIGSKVNSLNLMMGIYEKPTALSIVGIMR
jgi:hypothetical protein